MAHSSIINYVSGIRTLHARLALPYPGDSLELKLVLRGLSRLNPRALRQAAPMTPCILLEMFQLLDVSQALDAVFWSLFLMAFFTLARKSNLVPTGNDSVDADRHLKRRDVTVTDFGLLVCFHWTKTIQFKERVLEIPLVAMPGHSLCPVRAYLNMIKLVPASPDSAAFLLPSRRSVRPVKYKQFLAVLRHLLSGLGLDSSQYSTHSFRRGGATFAFHSDVPADLIQVQGDWASDAYRRYIDMSLEHRVQVSHRMNMKLMSL